MEKWTPTEIIVELTREFLSTKEELAKAKDLGDTWWRMYQQKDEEVKSLGMELATLRAKIDEAIN